MLTLMLAAAALASEAPRPELQPLQFLVGHCWRADFGEGKEQDTHCFETVYDGQHIRDRHEVRGSGEPYLGETLYSWNGKASQVEYTYWNSLGGVSHGSMVPHADRLDFGDETYTGADGKQATLSTTWRRVGADAYEAVTSSAELPEMSRTVRYHRVADDVAIAASRDASGNHVLAHEVVVAARAAKVWEAVSTAQGWKGWAAPVVWNEGDIIETSYTRSAQRGDATTIRQQLTARIPGRLLGFRTIKAPEGFPDFDTFRRVEHVIELEPLSAERTRVRLTGAGYADTEAGRKLLGFFREGNRISLERLRQNVEQGPVDWASVRQ